MKRANISRAIIWSCLVLLVGAVSFRAASECRFAVSKYKFGEMTALADKYGTDKGSGGNLYSEVYEYFFAPIKQTARKVFEIGIDKGASIEMWRDYFPKATIYGIDIIDESRFNSGRIKTFIADQANRGDLQRFVHTYGSDFDIILDDGGHSMRQQQVSLGALFKHVRSGGYYVIEDLGTSLFEKGSYEIDPDGKNTTLDMVLSYIKTGKIESKYLSSEEKEYLVSNIIYCNLLFRGSKGKVIGCIFKKR